MMQRLREQTSSPDPATARAAALLSAMPPLDAARLRRLPLPGPEVARRGAAGRMRTALVLAMTLGSVAAGAATLRESSWVRTALHAGFDPQARGTAVTAGPSQGPRPGSGGARVDETPADLPASPDIAPPAPVTPDGTAQPAVSPHLGAGRMASPRPRPSGALRGAPATGKDRARAVADESAIMVGAVRALRRDGDPARAQAMAEEALQKYPHGAQVEEAMALSMEAASANHDEAAAHRAASRYLASFPSGRFTDRAQRILGSPPR